MEQKPEFNFRRFVLIALPALIAALLIWGGYQLIAPLFDRVEPDTAAARFVSPTPDYEWQPFPLTSPTGEYTAILYPDSSGHPIVWVQGIENDEFGISLTLILPAAYYDTGAWIDDDTLAIQIDNGAVIWHWRETRIITARRVVMGAAVIIAIVGLVAAYLAARPK